MKSTVIICAYNEENTIANILFDICCIPHFNDVIVVNDGSVDNTKKNIVDLKQRLNFNDIHLEKNMGKGYAMAIGIENCNSELIVFIDADLSNFTEIHASQLISPLLNNTADMVLGHASDTLINYSINPFKGLTGQRALLRNEIIPIVDKIKPSGYGVETILNMHYKAKQKRVIRVNLSNLTHPTKFKKASLPVAIKEFAYEGYQIMNSRFSRFYPELKTLKRLFLTN
jgi:polyisoprenyl-phosphate glycosyltransferase